MPEMGIWLSVPTLLPTTTPVTISYSSDWSLHVLHSPRDEDDADGLEEGEAEAEVPADLDLIFERAMQLGLLTEAEADQITDGIAAGKAKEARAVSSVAWRGAVGMRSDPCGRLRCCGVTCHVREVNVAGDTTPLRR